MQDDITSGFQVPMPVDSVGMIVNGVISPHGIAYQSSINEMGERIDKNRITHDQSFEFSEGNSVNARLVRDDLPDLRHGRCLSQIIHYGHALRLSYPTMKIVAAKKDLKSACRRAHLHGFLAAMSLTIVGRFALISLRLPFGGAYCPYLWCIISEFVGDLANALLRCEFWDEKSLISEINY